MRPTGLLFFIAILLLMPQASAIELTIPPEQFDSHKAYVELLDSSRESLFEEVLALYDTRLSIHPGDIQAAVERCRFLDNALYDADEDYNPMAEEAYACISELEANHGNEPAVLELRLSQKWGDEVEPFYLDHILPRKPDFSPKLLARIHSHMSSTLRWNNNDAEKAALHAREAMSLDPTLNLHEILADFELQQGNRERALESTLKSIELAETPWELSAPINRLIEMEKFEKARAVLERQEKMDPEGIDPSQKARVLVGVGDFAGAREAYDQAATEMSWMSEEIRKERLRVELDHGDADSVLAAYNALRDTGFMADPLLRNRLDVFLHYPGAEWSLRDILGLLLILITVIGIVLLPAVFIAPLHYIALLLQQRKSATPPRPTIWGLRHVWFMIASFLLISALATFLFYPDAFIENMNSDELDIVVPEHALLPSIWLQIVGFTLALAAILRFRKSSTLWHNAWTWWRTLGFVALWVFVARVLAIISAAITSVGTAATYQERFLLAFGNAYGAIPLLLFLAVVVPVLEELAFRGVILDGLHRYFSFWIANILQSITFTFFHEDMRMVLVYFLIGMVAGEMRRRSKGLLVPIIFHAAFNLIPGAILLSRI